MAMDLKKVNNEIYSKLRKDKGVLWSFSAVSSYENCPYSRYLARVLKIEGVDNIYSRSGSLSHDILETHYLENTSREDMYNNFNKGMLEIFSDGYRFTSDKIEQGYMNNMRLYFQSFVRDNNIKRCEEFVAMPLWIHDSTLIDNFFQGWVDAVLDKDGNISIGDFKSSTIFKGKDLLKKSKQLILYAISYEYLYKKKVKNIFFDFLKYCEVTYMEKGKEKKKIIERKDIFMVDDIIRTDKAYVFVELTDDIKKETLDWFIGLIHEINNDVEFKKGEDCGHNSYFCKNLCSYAMSCEHVLTKR